MGKQSKDAYSLLKKRFYKLRSQYTKLTEEQTELKVTTAVLEGLVRQRNALVGVYQRLGAGQWRSDAGADDPSVAELFRLMPQRPLTQLIDQDLYNHVMGLTPAAAADIWLERIKEVALLLNMYERDPQHNHEALDRAATDAMRWNVAVHIFNPAVMYALQDYNLLLRRYDPAPPAHWAASAADGQLTEQQLQGMKALLSVVNPRLQQIEQERQKLLQELEDLELVAAEQTSSECSYMVQSLSLQDMPAQAAVPAGNQQFTFGAQHSTGLAGSTISSLTMQPPAQQLLSGGAMATHATAAGQAVAAHDDGDQVCTPASRSSGSSASGRVPTMADRTKLMQRREQVMQQLASNCVRWRVTTQMRGQFIVTSCTPVQQAKAMISAFPYMPHGAPILDTPYVQKGMANVGRKPPAQQDNQQEDVPADD